MRTARPEEIVMQDGSQHQCVDANGGTEVFCPLAVIDGRRYYCSVCGVVFRQEGGKYVATDQVIDERYR